MSKTKQAKIQVKARHNHIQPTVRYRAIHAEGWMATALIMAILVIRFSRQMFKLIRFICRISWPVIMWASKSLYKLASELVLWFYVRTH